MAEGQDRTTKGKCPRGISAARKRIWKQIYDLLSQRPLDLTRWREVGLLVEQYATFPSKPSSTDAMPTLGKSLGCAHSELYYARRLSQEHTQKALDKYQAKGFGWGRMMQVLSIQDQKARRALIEEAIRHSWSARRLKAELQQINDTATSSTRQRDPSDYASAKKVLDDLIRQSQNWIRHHERVWQGDQALKVKDPRKLPQEKSKALLELLQQAKGEIRQVARSCSQLEEGLDQMINDIVAVLMEKTD